jgi:hypothetical protein
MLVQALLSLSSSAWSTERKESVMRFLKPGLFIACIVLAAVSMLAADPLPPDITYRPLPTLPFSAVKANDEAQKPNVLQRQASTLRDRYDLANRPSSAMMSGGRKPVQDGVRVKLPSGVTWDSLAKMTPEEIKERRGLPEGFKPLPHVKQSTGGQVFPTNQIDQITSRSSATCVASTSTSTFRITSRRSSHRRSSSPRVRSSATSRAGSSSRSGTSTTS